MHTTFTFAPSACVEIQYYGGNFKQASSPPAAPLNQL